MALGEHLMHGDDDQYILTNQLLLSFYTKNSFSDDGNFDDPEELEYIKNAAVAAFMEDDSTFSQKELMYYCHRAKTPDLAGIAIADAVTGSSCDCIKLENYIIGIRDIIQNEYTIKSPDESFLTQIMQWAKSEKDQTRLLVCGVVCNVVRLLQNSSNSCPEQRIYFIRAALDMNGWERADNADMLAISASQLYKQLFRDLKETDAEYKSAAAGRDKLRNSLYLTMTIHKKSGNKEEAAQYKNELLGL